MAIGALRVNTHGVLSLALLATFGVFLVATSSAQPTTPPTNYEYLWYEAENMRGLTASSSLHEPLLNPSYLDFPASKTPGWCISGPGVSAEWSQGGESEWNSVAASFDETRANVWEERK